MPFGARPPISNGKKDKTSYRNGDFGPKVKLKEKVLFLWPTVNGSF